MCLMRECVLVYINGQRHEVSERDAFLSLSDYLRLKLGLVGTKIVCSEGDCGACTVLVGRPDGERLKYQSVDSCILFLFQLDSTHIVTVEGLQQGAALTEVQQSMIDCHGSQCGFCTPGFVVALTGMLEYTSQLDEACLRYGLTGNLCRCTGYATILEAATQVDGQRHSRIEKIYPSAQMLKDFASSETDEIEVRAAWASEEHYLSSPTQIESAVRFLEVHPDALIVAGATDIGVRINKTRCVPAVILALNRLAAFDTVTVENGQLIVGAGARWTDVEAICEEFVPELHHILTLFGSPQIRNIGTIGGNIMNASPIADSLPFLHAMDATLELCSAKGAREVDINDFYLGYKQLDLHSGELLTRIHVPLPSADDRLRLYKVSRRRDLDISGFTAAINMRFSGDTIVDAAIAFGAVGPTVVRARVTEQYLRGQSFTEETMWAAGDFACKEIAPISDVRGSAEYRLQLTRNVLLKYYHQTQVAAAPA